MKTFIISLLILSIATPSFAYIRRTRPYYRNDGTFVNSSYRDTSNDGNPYNNANYLGYNGQARYNQFTECGGFSNC